MKLKQVFSSTEDLDEILSNQEMGFLNGGLAAESAACGNGGKCKKGSGCERGGGCSNGGTTSSVEELSAW